MAKKSVVVIDPGDEADAIERIRDIMLVVMQDHEKRHPGTGEPCWPTRLSMLALLAHSAGVGPDTWQAAALADEIRRYAEMCPGCAAHPPEAAGIPEDTPDAD